MSLSARDRAKVNAALLEIHHAGLDTGEVTNFAARVMDTGTPPRIAYERAFNSFVQRFPDFQAPLQRIGQFVEAADPQMLARYDLAMSNYIATGDRAHIDAIVPAVTHDLAKMPSDGNPTARPVEQEARAGQGWGAMGYSPTDAKARPEAPLPPPTVESPSAPSRPGWPAGGQMGFQPSAARADQTPSG